MQAEELHVDPAAQGTPLPWGRPPDGRMGIEGGAVGGGSCPHTWLLTASPGVKSACGDVASAPPHRPGAAVRTDGASARVQVLQAPGYDN